MRAVVRPPAVQVFHVWRDNVIAMQMWDIVGTQWHEASDADGSRRTGLHYACVEAALRMQGVPADDHAARFEELRAMERGALQAWSERRRAEQAKRHRR